MPSDFTNRQPVLLGGKSNYTEWRDETKAILIKEGFWGIVSGTTPKTEENAAAWESSSRRAWAEIYLLLKTHIKASVGDMKSSKELWDRLEVLYDKTYNSDIYNAVQQLKLGDSTSFKNLSDYAEHMRKWGHRLTKLNQSIPDTILANLFICGLPKEVEPYWMNVVTLSDSNQQSITFDKVVDEVLAHERRENDRKNVPRAPRTGSLNKPFEKSKGKGDDRPFSKGGDVKCLYCNTEGHRTEVCYYLHPERRPRWWKPVSRKPLLSAEESNKQEPNSSTINFAESQDEWYPESEADTPITKNEKDPLRNDEPQPNSAKELTAALNDDKTHLLLAASGSVAIVKLQAIISSFSQHSNLSIRIILTQNAVRFLTGRSPEQPTIATLSTLPHVDAIYQDSDEWASPWTRDSSILHIELRRWAHLLVVAPLTANTLAKISAGLADNLLTSLIRAWDPKRARIIVAVAMNSAMWTHPITAKQIRVLEEEWGVNNNKRANLVEVEEEAEEGWIQVLNPQVKTLACGDTGPGGMCDWQDVVGAIEKQLQHIL